MKGTRTFIKTYLYLNATKMQIMINGSQQEATNST